MAAERLRSDAWFRRDDEVGLEHRAAMRSAGAPVERGESRPIIALVSSISDLNPCNLPLGRLVDRARQGVIDAGGIPAELPVMSLGEDLMKPTAMLYRNLLSIEVEEYLRADPVDGVVLFGNCDKTIPAELMAAASVDLPTVQVAGGFRMPGMFRGREVGAGTDLWSYWDERRAGRLDESGWRDLEVALSCSQGACNVMGTAMTMAILAEALGLMLPGGAVLPSHDPRLDDVAYRSGVRAVELVRDGVTASAVLTEDAFDDALTVLAAIGGSTNAVLHLAAIAGRRGIRLDPDAVDRAAQRVPVLADIAPIGRQHIVALDSSGGVPALLDELRPLLHGGRTTVAGAEDGTAVRPAGSVTGTAIRPLDRPVTEIPAFAVVTGTLAPDGALIKAAAARAELLVHRGRAVVFDDYQTMLDTIDDPALEITADDVLVLRNCGPRGGDGFPEWGMIPIPAYLAEQGVTDMVRISDARMSGTSFGTCVLHVAPDAASGGPLSLVETGDTIALDVTARRLDVELDDEELARRAQARRPRPPRHDRGWPRLYEEHVTQAPQGADLDFLLPAGPQDARRREPVIGRS